MKIGFFACRHRRDGRAAGGAAVATAAERLGFATLWAPEHVVLVEQYASKYPYSSGQFPGPPDIRSPTPSPRWPMRPHAPARSGSVPGSASFRAQPIGAGQDRGDARPAFRAAVILGAGVGWLAEEFAALGVPFEHRGARTREYIDVMRQLWTRRRVRMPASLSISPAS